MQSDMLRERNVTLRDPEVQGYFPCPTCKQLRTVLLTKRQKPYVTCNDCEVQVFIRGKEGIRRMREMLGHGELSGNVRGLAPLLEYGTFLRGRLREIHREKPLLGKNQNLETEEKLVEAELARVRKVLESELKETRRQLRQFKQERDE